MADFYDLIADLGGTYLRLALVYPINSTPRHVCQVPVEKYSSLESAISDYLEKTSTTLQRKISLNRACFAVAGPVKGDEVQLTNGPWKFSQKQIARKFALNGIKVINDLTAISLIIGESHPKKDFLKDVIQLGKGNSTPEKPLAIIAPGTGLGIGEVFFSHKGSLIPIGSEGGHSDWAPTNDLEIEVFKFLRDKFQRVSLERVLSGPGLTNLYQALCHIHQRPSQYTEPADISEQGVTGKDDLCVQSLSLFCEILGKTAGNMALNFGATGGVYLCGGILRQIKEFVVKSPLRDQFEAKGRFKNYMSAIPTYLVTLEQPGLFGAAIEVEKSHPSHPGELQT